MLQGSEFFIMEKPFNEQTLEQAIIDIFKSDVDYLYCNGSELHREIDSFILEEDLQGFLELSLSKHKITEHEIHQIISDIKSIENKTLYEGNKKFLNWVTNGYKVKRNNPNDKDFVFALIDFENPLNNTFRIVNQIEIKENEKRIPDAIVFINGLPLIVFEFKSAVKENTTIKNAYDQLTITYKRAIPTLFKYNAFVVISDGVNNKYGSFFADYEYFYSWRVEGDVLEEQDGINSLFTLIRGLFNKETLVDVIHDFIYFPDTSDDNRKIICRYPQYYGAKKLYENIKHELKPNGSGKGGTYFGATGCGKSQTMLYLTRLLIKDTSLSSPTIVLITDRNDLDNQLSQLFINSKEFLRDKNVNNIANRDNLKKELANRTSGGVYLTTIQKFSEDTNLLSSRNNIICISDEAHRTQINLNAKNKRVNDEIIKSYGFARYLHESLPNATFVGFTGTPIDATLEVFGNVVSTYTMSESVYDGITVNIVYEGRCAKVTLNNDKVKLIEKYYEQCEKEGANEYQIEESQKAVSKLEVIIGDPTRIKAVAKDLVGHYENRVREHATVKGKAMIVCMNRAIAFNLYKEIVALKPEWLEEKANNNVKGSTPIPYINLVMTYNKYDEDELVNLLKRYDKDILEKEFKNKDSNFKIAIVVDMWLTGFDCPSLDTMYIDKPIQQHTLIQTISRVNRVFPGKEKGLIVDYFGIKNNMNLALKKYNNEDQTVFEGIEASIKIVKEELEILNTIFRNFNFSPFFDGSSREKLECLNKAVEFVQTTKELEERFMANVKRMKSAFNLCSYSDNFSDRDRDLIYFYGAIRSVIFKISKGDVPDIHQMNDKVTKMIQDAIISQGVEEIFSQTKRIKTREIDIFSDEYLEKINKIPYPNTKIKILAQLAKDAIDEYRKINKIKGVEFAERLKTLIDSYNNRHNEKIFAEQVLDNVAADIEKLIKDLKIDKASFEEMGVTFEEKAFYDILESVAKRYNFYDKYIGAHGEDYLINLAKEIKKIVDDKSKYTDWSKKEDIKAELKVDIILKLAEFDYPPFTQDDVYKEIFEQAENFKKYNE